MNNVEIKVRLEEEVELPQYKTEGSVGFDLSFNKIKRVFKGDVETAPDKVEKMQKAFLDRGFIKMRPFERILFGTGVYLQLPEGHDIEIRPRSGTALKTGLIVTNSPGTIDTDYVDEEIGVIISNPCPFLTEVRINERMAQAVVRASVTGVVLQEVEVIEYDGNKRSGFGSTGNK